jgi:NADH-quinone oxidoreductase subunit A
MPTQLENGLLTDYAYIALFLMVSIIFTAVMILLPVALRMIGLIPQKPNPIKNSTFECGMETIGKTWVRFNFRYYFFAVMFVALDVMVVFLLPWAVGLQTSGTFGLAAISLFIVIIAVGYVYAWKKKVLEWK